MSELLSMARGLKDSYSLSNKQKKNVSSHGSPCSITGEATLRCVLMQLQVPK